MKIIENISKNNPPKIGLFMIYSFMQIKSKSGLWVLRGKSCLLFKGSLLTKDKIYTFTFMMEITNTLHWQFLRLIRPTNPMPF